MQNQKFGRAFCPRGAKFAGTPELQSILIKINNTKFEKIFQNFLHLRNLTWDPFPLNFDTGPNQP